MVEQMTDAGYGKQDKNKVAGRSHLFKVILL